MNRDHESTRERRYLLGEMSETARANLPCAYRLRAFCIRHGLSDELERLIRDEIGVLTKVARAANIRAD